MSRLGRAVRRRSYRSLAAAGGAIVIGISVLSGCGSSATRTDLTASPPAMVARLDTAVSGSQGTWAVLAMGDIGQLDDTFWQSFYLPPTGGRWALRTPPGVADNGGLVIASRGAQLVTGFLPSNLLRFAPLALTSDEGKTYAPALLPDALADVPDALSFSTTGTAVALTGEEVVAASAGLSSWSPLITSSAIGASAAGASCGLQRLTAVVATPASVVVGADCSHTSMAGVFAVGTARGTRATAQPTLAGPTLPAGARPAAIDVLRLVPYKAGLALLMASNPGPRPTYRAAWESTLAGPWTLGPALPSWPLVSTSVTAAGGFVILTGGAPSSGSGGGPLGAATIGPGQASWSILPTPPATTAALVVTVPPGGTEALGVDSATFSDYRLTAGRWAPAQTIAVPIAFGSSS